ncbi:Type II/IV secretion system protein TadC, associated with Flp pilus assembly [hydrothermal vent metagenome]|uniref:Type II/IV secretion system protein TadC, associated with Flp pilus assembly n=1 Tax=hydrothermal vent metagenome TaxID=652676 RepID=A0A3B0T1S8_9ZZZZ
MLDIIFMIRDPQFLLVLFVGVTAFATILTLSGPLLDRDKFEGRMKAVSTERSKLRQQQRDQLEKEHASPARLRRTNQGPVKQIVDRLNLQSQFNTEEIGNKLKMAGLRGPKPLYIFMFARIVLPLVFFAGAAFYLFFIHKGDQSGLFKLMMSLGGLYAGYYFPNVILQNLIQRRQFSIKRAFPDSLDLLLICVESGMSIEGAFQKVAKEIGAQSIEMAEEMALTTAELSYLSERRQAYENLHKRTGLDGVKAVVTSLMQAERYGTPLAQSLRVMAQENRDMRMAEAEKKAAALPPKLTVPMIAFFLPVLFVVILGPAIIKVNAL